jgi:hypothetical protein
MNYSKLKHPDVTSSSNDGGNSRRSFIKKATAATVTLAGTNLLSLAINSPNDQKEPMV